jgi:serine/threonine protein kinase
MARRLQLDGRAMLGLPGRRREGALPAQFGKYQILGSIAKGGMAEIYLARAIGIAGFEKLVVVKRVLPHLTDDPQFVRMFLDEARLAATFQHPNIVQVFDIGRTGDDYFFAMEFLHGQDAGTTLQRLVTRGRQLPIEHAIQIVIGVCGGLHYAHEKRGPDGAPLDIVHRDVSPSNVFVTYDGGVKLVDFGIAKASHKEQTRYGTLKGKLRYMSPEQACAIPIDRRSDIFSASVLLWELTTWRRLFAGQNDLEVLKAIVEREAPRPSSVVPGYPRELERIVMKGLARDPRERHATAQDMQAELEAFARHERLPVSSIALSRFMRQLFGDKLEAWHTAQLSADALTAHVVATRAGAQTSWLEDEVGKAPPPARGPRRHVIAGMAIVAAALAVPIVLAPGRKIETRPVVPMIVQQARAIAPLVSPAPPPAEPPRVAAPRRHRSHHHKARPPAPPAPVIDERPQQLLPIDFDAPLSP